jgi:type II secretory ATPase GspE/PulE/Tfp pilus assembly ATPase PilB-like protein
VAVLDSLPPEELAQELLGRVLMKGIGRLYLEQQATHGRVLWSQEGVVQSVLETLPADRFQGLIDELKQVAGLSKTRLKQSKQLDIERIFDHERLLLRFRFMPTEHGEEATLQVLRGAALRFYQQQQLSVLERDALGIAKQLQGKLSELRDRAYAESTLSGARLEILPALSRLLQEMEAEIKTMQAAIAMPEDTSRRKPDA